MNAPVSFPIAKLLKEKGFDQKLTDNGYNVNGEESFDYTIDRINGVGIAAPTIADVVMWLYEKHGIWISVDWTVFFKEKVWFYSIKQKNQSSKLKSLFNSPTEAYEAAIEYTLNNLI